MKSAGKRQANKKVNVLFNVINIRTSFRRSLLFQPNGFHFKGIFLNGILRKNSVCQSYSSSQDAYSQNSFNAFYATSLFLYPLQTCFCSFQGLQREASGIECKSSRSQMFYKQVFLKLLQIHRKTPVLESLF